MSPLPHRRKPCPLPSHTLLLFLLSLPLSSIFLLISSSFILPAEHQPSTETATSLPSKPPSETSPEKQEAEEQGRTQRGRRRRRNVGPYRDWELFRETHEEMKAKLKIFAYPDISNASSPFAGVFLPLPDPSNRKLGNYYSEHIFKIALLRSPLLVSGQEKARFFYIPFSANALRNDPRVKSEAKMAEFVGDYAEKLRGKFLAWNESDGADHFFVGCHSVARAAVKGLRAKALFVGCSASYFQRSFVAHRDVSLPQVWPRPPETNLTPALSRRLCARDGSSTRNASESRERTRMMPPYVQTKGHSIWCSSGSSVAVPLLLNHLLELVNHSVFVLVFGHEYWHVLERTEFFFRP
ncbi:uncharacterized protein LOC144704812 isoform X2 [Wolffia australiana]